MNRLQLISFLFLLLPTLALAQTKPPAEPQRQRVRIDNAAVLNYLQQGDREVVKLVGEVQLRQDSIFMYCDSAIIENSTQVFALGEVTIQQGDSISAFADTLYYDGIKKEADLIGEVVLINGQQKLYTQRLHYNLNTKLATYLGGATLTDGQTQVSSRRGYYYAGEQVAFFKDSVVVIDPRFDLRADTLQFNVEEKLVRFLGPTVMRTENSRVYCEAGFYNIQNNTAEFRKNAQYESGEQRATAKTIRYEGDQGRYHLLGDARFVEGDKRLATADTISYDQANDVTRLRGNAFFRDSLRRIEAPVITYDAKRKVYSTAGRSRISDPPQLLEANAVDYREELGLGIASGNVIWQDTSAELTIVCEEAAYNRQTGYLKASGGARGRPLLISLVDGDSLFMTSDTLLSQRADSLAGDSSRILLAYRDVRIFKSDMQALCDSLSYSSVDSTFRFYRQPILWADTSQFSADTMHLRLANKQVDGIDMFSNSFIVNSPDETIFNQIKGKYITSTFVDNELRRMHVEGNAEAIYYAQDDDDAYVGVNKTICSEMIFHFTDNQVDEITFLAQPQGRLDPMGSVNHGTMRLEGFRWETEIRPLSLDALFGPPPRTLGPVTPPTEEEIPTEEPAPTDEESVRRER